MNLFSELSQYGFPFWVMACGFALMAISGAAFGTFREWKEKDTKAERKQFLQQISVLYIAITLLLLGVFLLPDPYSFYIHIPFLFFILFWDKRRRGHPYNQSPKKNTA